MQYAVVSEKEHACVDVPPICVVAENRGDAVRRERNQRLGRVIVGIVLACIGSVMVIVSRFS